MRIIDKIFRDKKVNSLIYIILAVGIAMLVCANSFSSHIYPEPKIAENISSLEEETEKILAEIEGVGKVDVMISYENGENKDEIRGVLVVAQGGKNSNVKEKIIRALRAALGTDAHKIEVFERKE